MSDNKQINLNFKTQIQRHYCVSPSDFQIDNESLDSNFKDSENTRIDLLLDGSLIGYIILTKQNKEQNPFVRFIWIYPEFRGNKYSKELYLAGNRYCISQYNQALCSDEFNFIKKSAFKVWESLVEQGLAIKKDTDFEMNS